MLVNWKSAELRQKHRKGCIYQCIEFNVGRWKIRETPGLWREQLKLQQQHQKQDNCWWHFRDLKCSKVSIAFTVQVFSCSRLPLRGLLSGWKEQPGHRSAGPQVNRPLDALWQDCVDSKEPCSACRHTWLLSPKTAWNMLKIQPSCSLQHPHFSAARQTVV